MNETLSLEDVSKVLDENFAPWIKMLNLQPQSTTGSGMVFVMPENADLSREGDIICGQAIASVADTAGVLALCAHNNRFRPVTTVDMTTHFLRPLFKGDVEAEVSIMSNGKRLASLRVDFRKPGSPKICAAATCAYAYLD